MHIHILGICGTFMAGIAQLAVELGHRVTGCDAGVYPPMSELLAEAGIPVAEGWSALAAMESPPDLVIVGNALSRGNPAVEFLLDSGLPFTSGPAWLADNVLRHRHVIAIAGTHGKTTTSSLVAWILAGAGLEPGFLIGGIPRNFGRSARLGRGNAFVIEADEYDTAFFDKRPKFMHYLPRTLVINNVEFDHADIFADLAAVKLQFQYLLRTVPARGLVVANADDGNLAGVLARGCWSRRQRFGRGAECEWRLLRRDPASGECALRTPSGDEFTLTPPLIGEHNAYNLLAALAAASGGLGVEPTNAARLAQGFASVKRRLELLDNVAGIYVYDDFAHHPTAVRATLSALRERVGPARIVAVLEPRSNTMRAGHHRNELARAFDGADRVLLFEPPGLNWNLEDATRELAGRRQVCRDLDGLLAALVTEAATGDHIVVMSNGGFGGIHMRLLDALRSRAGTHSGA